MLVNGGQSANFSYPTFDMDAALFVAGNLYDVTTGVAVFISQIVMAYEASGVYVGNFTPTSGHNYLVIAVVYIDGTYTTLDISRAPWGANYEASIADTASININYGAFDQNGTLSPLAKFINMTDSTTFSVVMVHVFAGVYFAQTTGAIGKQYLTVVDPSNGSYSPSSDSFQCFAITGPPSTDPGIAKVLRNTVYVIDGVTLVGTLIPADPNACIECIHSELIPGPQFSSLCESDQVLSEVYGDLIKTDIECIEINSQGGC